MTQKERLIYLIEYLLKDGGYSDPVPEGEIAQRSLARALFNVREPKPVSDEFLRVQDEYLKERAIERGITRLSELTALYGDFYLWKGDITTLECGAIVNAANNRLLGCFVPGHKCIDNAIHTYAGVELRAECNEVMKKQGHLEPTGKAKVTGAYNLPCDYVIHTVGPIVYGALTDEHKKLLADCYENCLIAAEEKGVESIAFCCISTGEFMFPNEAAAQIAVLTCKAYKERTASKIKIIFNVFKEKDNEIYAKVLGRYFPC